MPRRYMLAYACRRHVQGLSFTLLIGCHAADAKSVGESPHALPQTHTAVLADSAGAEAPPALPQTHAVDAPMLAGSAGAAAQTDTKAADSAPMFAGGAAGAPVLAPRAEDRSPGKVELRCADGATGQLPAGYSLIAADVGGHKWTFNDGTLSWLDTSVPGSWTLFRKPLSGDAAGTPTGGVTSGPDLIAQVDGLAADGGDVFLRASELVGRGERKVMVRQMPGQTLAEAAGTGLGEIAVDQDALYWLAAEDERISLYRTPRTAAETRSLGRVPFAWARSAQTQANVTGLVALGDYVYAALSSSGRGQVYRAAKGSNDPLAPLGAALAPVAGLTTDGTDLVLVLEPERNDFGDASTSARIVRMTDSGEVHEITTIAAAGPSTTGSAGMYVAVSGGLVFWTDNQQSETWFGTLWSAPLDGSRGPTKELSTPGNVLSAGLVAADGAVYFAVYCRVDHGNEVSGRTHIVQLQL